MRTRWPSIALDQSGRGSPVWEPVRIQLIARPGVLQIPRSSRGLVVEAPPCEHLLPQERIGSSQHASGLRCLGDCTLVTSWLPAADVRSAAPLPGRRNRRSGAAPGGIGSVFTAEILTVAAGHQCALVTVGTSSRCVQDSRGWRHNPEARRWWLGVSMAGPVVQKHHRGAILLTLCFAVLAINLDTTIVNVALPTLVRDLDASTRELQWIVDAYALVFAALVLAAGSISDRVGRKGALLVGLAIFGTGSVIGSQCSSPGQLIAVRAFIGLGAAVIFPATLSIISNVFTGRAERAKAIGLWGAMTGLGVAAGPICGGWLLERFWWGSVFLALVPVAAIVAALVAWVVPTSRDPHAPRFDRGGLVLSTAAIGTLVYTIIEAPDAGWSSVRSVVGFATAAVLFAVFVWWERRTWAPMLDVRLFENLRFSAASGSVTVAFFALFGFIFMVTLYFQFLKAYSPFETGIRILPVAASLAIAAVIGTRLAVRVGNKAVVST